LAPVVRWERRKGIVSVDITFLARGVHEFSYARYELANVTVIFDRPNVLTEHSYSKQGFIIFIINENKSIFSLFCTKLVVSLCQTLHSRSKAGDMRLVKTNTGKFTWV